MCIYLPTLHKLLKRKKKKSWSRIHHVITQFFPPNYNDLMDEHKIQSRGSISKAKTELRQLSR